MKPMSIDAKETRVIELYDTTVLHAILAELQRREVIPDTHYVKDLTPQRGGYGWHATLAPRSLQTPAAT